MSLFPYTCSCINEGNHIAIEADINDTAILKHTYARFPVTHDVSDNFHRFYSSKHLSVPGTPQMAGPKCSDLACGARSYPLASFFHSAMTLHLPPPPPTVSPRPHFNFLFPCCCFSSEQILSG